MKKEKIEKKVAKRDTITIRLSPDWDSYIEQTAAELSKQMEIEVTKTWIVTQLMKIGLPLFEKKYNVRRKDPKSA